MMVAAAVAVARRRAAERVVGSEGGAATRCIAIK